MTSPTNLSLTTTQMIILALYGAALWFLAAMIIRFVGPMGAFEGSAMAITFVLVVPGTIPAILFARKLAQLVPEQTAIGTTVITAAALLLDGIAHAWFPTLYGADPALHVDGAATIFWGAGVGLVLGLFMNGVKR
jgi:hypothetical protein